ncbi:MAG: HRDC domain-containing protein [Planctomycetales bacterium]|nr:HRDC domain-containing protein [Planctomycetales bacterium]
MPIAVFSRGCPESSGELNQFLRTRRVVSIERHLVSESNNAYWSFCVEYLERNNSQEVVGNSRRSGKPKIDYREVLTETEFADFAKLRGLRKELAAAEGVPIYAVFTNEQLAALARAKAQTTRTGAD